MKNWELSFGFYPGIMLGFRTYNEAKKNQKKQTTNSQGQQHGDKKRQRRRG